MVGAGISNSPLYARAAVCGIVTNIAGAACVDTRAVIYDSAAIIFLVTRIAEVPPAAKVTAVVRHITKVTEARVGCTMTFRDCCAAIHVFLARSIENFALVTRPSVVCSMEPLYASACSVLTATVHHSGATVTVISARTSHTTTFARGRIRSLLEAR